HEILHVMADLMCDHIGLREPARSAIAATEARLDLPEERRVEVDLLVRRAIEWAHRALRQTAAAGIRLLVEQDQRRHPVSAPVFRKNVLPHRFRAAEHARHESTGLVGRGASRARLRRLTHAGLLVRQYLSTTDQQPRIDAKRPADHAQNQYRADREAARATKTATKTAAKSAGARTLSATILDVAALWEVFILHRRPSSPLLPPFPPMRAHEGYAPRGTLRALLNIGLR